ncbi:hypothetical protein HK105_206375 [Polyrhizophydium stewartii]|uniref:Ankyrin repeat protein n=1 Tax=Polyrhizophydium stewartii TaxID=2732419 RepID=A0ABR4N3L1_9FUNG
MADIRTNDAPAAVLATPPPPAQHAATHAELAAALTTAHAPLASQLVDVHAKLDAVQAELVDVKSDPAATEAQHDRLAERLDGQPAPPPAGPPPLAATPASTNKRPPPSTTSEAARAKRFRPDATNEWDRMPAEIQNMILAHVGVLTLWVNGRIDDLSNISLEHFKSMLCDVFETNWEGDLTKLPFKKFEYCRLDETFWRIRSRGMHARVKVLGLKFLQGGLDQAAIRNGWTDLLNFDKLYFTSRNAARCGSISMLQHLVDERKAVTLNMDHAGEAATFGHLEVLKWLHERMPNRNWTTWVMDDAARNGHIDCVKWLHVNRTEGCTTYAMDYAAKNGHLDVVKWLHANRTEGCTTEAIDDTARNGHLDVVKWLHANRTEGCTSFAMNWAAGNGHANVVEWLHKNRTEGNLVKAATAAACHDQLAVLQLIRSLAPNAITPALVNEAASNGHPSVLEWLINEAGLRPADSMISKAINAGKLHMLPWFRKHTPKVFRAHKAAKVGNQAADAVIDWFDRNNLPNASDVARLAIEEHRVLVVKWLLEHMHKSKWYRGDLERALELVDAE